MKGTTRTYNSWSGMLQRCYNIMHPRYQDYGGRCIEVCDSWRIFDNFLGDMGERPENKIIDRLNNDGDYCKENCAWVTYEESAANKRTYRNNTSGMKGVSQNRGRWMAYVNKNGKRICSRR
jgi:hypothetical protein